MISEMTAVEVLGPIDLFPVAVDVIQNTGTLHIMETPLAEFGRADLLSKIHLTENQAQERDTCAKIVELLDEMIAEIPAHIARPAGSSRAASSHPGRPDECSHPLLPHRFQASPLSGGLAAFHCITGPK